ncbi:MAG: hypothetical protein WCC32_08660 [Terriglobales bacterium]
MHTFSKDETLCRANRGSRSLVRGICVKGLPWLLLLGTMVLSACGGGGSSAVVPVNATLSGNWQFTMAPPADGSYLGGLQGGFLLQANSAATGAATYAVSLPELPYPCNSGSATITGMMSTQNGWQLTAVAGTQTFTLTGTLSLDGLTMAGTYNSTAGTAGDGSPCGTAQTGLQWSAVLIQPLTGSLAGNFHSAGGAAGLAEQDFLVSGSLVQAANTGSSSAVVTGTLTFLNSLADESDYPCFTVAALYGQVSGNSIALQITGSDGTVWGLIGEPVGSLGSTGVNPVTVNAVHGGYVLQGAGPSYSVATNACPGSLGNLSEAGDFGSICLALNGVSACQQPITLTPSALIFETQTVGAPPAYQTITLANASGNSLGSVTLNLVNDSGTANYTETDACGVNGAASLGQPFNLVAGQSCAITIGFGPLETCAVGLPPDQCPSPLNATLIVTTPSDGMIISMPITGTAVSEDAAATDQFDFGLESILEARVFPAPLTSGDGQPPRAVATNASDRISRCGGDHAEIE